MNGSETVSRAFNVSLTSKVIAANGVTTGCLTRS